MTVTISIGSGKGGTGKTMIVSNIALLLARSGYKTCLIDLDLGGADTHILFGQTDPKRSLTDFLNRKCQSLTEITQTLYSYHGLQMIAGTGDTLQTSNISFSEKQRLLREIDQLKADVVLIDIGAGTSYHALDFFMHSQIQLCVTLPDPTAIMDLYNFLQLATIRKMLSPFLSQSEVAQLLKKKNFRSLQEVFVLTESIEKGARAKTQQALRDFHPLLLVNRAHPQSQVNKEKLCGMIKKYLSIEMPELGDIPEDPQVGEALKALIPLCELYPLSPAATALMQSTGKLKKLIELFRSRQQTAASDEKATEVTTNNQESTAKDSPRDAGKAIPEEQRPTTSV